MPFKASTPREVQPPWADYRTWSQRGLCRQSTDSYWTSDITTHNLMPSFAIICARCPVRTLCLDFALNTEASDGESGVWGGTTPHQRRLLKKELSRKKCPGCQSDAVAPHNGGEICISCGLSWMV